MKKMSVRVSILLPSLIVLAAGIIAMVIAVGSISSSTANNLSQRLISARVNEYSNKFEALSLETYGISISLTAVVDNLSSLPNPRETTIDMLSAVLMKNENMLGIWTCWEPDAFDGNDSKYANTPNHDSTGRFVPYVYKSGSSFSTEELRGYDIPGEGDYYLGARNSGKPYITDPYEYDIEGKSTSLYTIAAPIFRNGAVAGVVGIDIILDDVISTMNEGSILDTGYLFTLSNDGVFATHRDSNLLMKSYQTTWMKDYASNIDSILANGGDFSVTTYSDQLNENIEFLASGVKIGDTEGYWVVCGVVPEKTVKESSATLIWLVIGIGVALIVIAGLTIFMLVRTSLKNLPVMTEMAATIAKGDINLNLHTGTEQTKNEITLLERAFADMTNSIKEQAEVMARIAQGDYSMSVPVRCEADAMNRAINDMIDRTNETMSEIQLSTAQVATGSKQIADGSQALAQGSVQQSAAVEQLSSSISEIAEKTSENAEMASRAAELAGTIMQDAEKGSRQMGEMMTAVKEINDASQSISKVIAVIDNIAFQTNILALNAAVEAARAGQHGKGFAVVAEEVRNLASKSADAARDTGSLIANSMEKAELGARIAEETAASLVKIVSGIGESNQLMGDIAKSSGEQSLGISQINKGIDQVAQVVQQNSATAEESAAVSEEISGQSNMLESLISQFKLKDNGNRRLNSNTKAAKKQLAMPEKPVDNFNDFGKY